MSALHARARPPGAHRQRGAALLLAMLVLTLVATLAAGMVWQQWRGIEIERAGRLRAQGGWLLNGALDWARLILREDARNGGADHLGEPWALPLAETRLSTFLATDRDNTLDDAGPEAFLSGRISDLQARWNLQNLLEDDEALATRNLQALQRLCSAAGVGSDVAPALARGLRQASRALDSVDLNSSTGAATRTAGSGGADQPLLPRRAEDLVWLGLDPAAVQRLLPFVTLLPIRTQVNANTAPAEVLMAAVAGLDRGSAERLVQARQRQPFRNVDDVKAQLAPALQDAAANLAVNSQFFEVEGRLRYEDNVLRERSLVQRKGLDMIVLRRDRLDPLAP